MPKGKKNLEDLNFSEQFYYDKLIQFINDRSISDDECVRIIDILDKLVDEFNKAKDNLLDALMTKVNKLYDIIEEYEGD